MRITRTLAPAALVLAAAACSSAGGDTAPAPAPAPEAAPEVAAAPAGEAFYTAAQADEGELLFRDFCSGCHSSGEFTGAGFLGSWGGRTAHDLFGFISQNMPEDAPGMLEPQEYADVIAYFFELNELPSGDARLTPDEALLESIEIPRP